MPLSISFAALLSPDGERRPVGGAIAVTWIVTEPLEKLAIHRRLPQATAIDAGSLAGRKSLSLIIFIALGLIRSISGVAPVNPRVAGSNPA
jgi:hypothetical protein